MTREVVDDFIDDRRDRNAVSGQGPSARLIETPDEGTQLEKLALSIRERYNAHSTQTSDEPGWTALESERLHHQLTIIADEHEEFKLLNLFMVRVPVSLMDPFIKEDWCIDSAPGWP